MLEEKRKMWIVGAIGVVVLVLGMVYFWVTGEKEEYFVLEGENEIRRENGNVVQNEMEEALAEMVVHVSGQVVNPGVVKLKEGARIIDAIEMAGGVTEEADLEKVNLAYLLEDAQKVYIPSKKEKIESAYVLEGSGEEAVLLNEGAEITANAFGEGLPWSQSVGSFILMLCLAFFAFTTILGWDYYSERCLAYLTKGNMTAQKVFKWLYVLAVLIGPFLTVTAVWTIAEILNGFMAIPNLIGLLALSGVVAAETRSFFARLKDDPKLVK